MLDEMCATLGGRAAEDLFVGKISTGAMNDLEQLENSLETTVKQRSLKEALKSSSSGIIAEFKRRSPSKGWIHRNVSCKGRQLLLPANLFGW